MSVEIRKLEIQPDILEGLPLYFHRIFYNELMDRELESVQYFYDGALKCLTSYREPERSVSTIMDHSKCIFINNK